MSKAPEGESITINMDQVEFKSQAVFRELTGRPLLVMEYLWDKMIPTSSLSLVAGAPGIGKTTVAMAQIAALTNGTLEGKHKGKPVGVLIVAPEDHMDARIRPALIGMGANMEMIQEWTGVLEYEGLRDISLPDDLPILTEKLEQVRAGGLDIRMVYVDSFVTTLPKTTKIADYKGIGDSLKPLSKWSEDNRMTTWVTWHLRKNVDGDDIVSAINGSVGLTAAARSVLVARRDDEVMDVEEDVTYGVIALVKSNVASSNIAGHKYLIRTHEYQGVTPEGEEATGEVGVLEWTGRTTDSGLATLAAAMVKQADLNKYEEAIIDFLSKQPEYKAKAGDVANAVKKATKSNSASSISRAKTRLAIVEETVTEHVEGGPPRNYKYWVLPECYRADKPLTPATEGDEPLFPNIF